MLQQSGAISELHTEMRADIAELRLEMRTEIRELRAEGRARSAQTKDLHQRITRVEGLLEGLRPGLASAVPLE